VLDQTILVTGSCGRIGFQTSLDLLQAGYSVVLSDINDDILEKTLNRIPPELHSRATLISADVTSPESIENMLQTSIQITKRIDGVVHSAYPRTTWSGLYFEDLDPNALFSDLIAQLGSAIVLSQKAVQLFRAQGSGSLIHISSIQGIAAPKFEHYEGTSMSSTIGYTAIKAGIVGITKWLAKYTANSNIRVNCVTPGGIIDNQDVHFQERYRKSCTSIGLLSPHHVSSAIVFLMSDQASAINGQNLVVDDGWSL